MMSYKILQLEKKLGAIRQSTIQSIQLNQQSGYIDQSIEGQANSVLGKVGATRLEPEGSQDTRGKIDEGATKKVDSKDDMLIRTEPY